MKRLKMCVRVCDNEEQQHFLIVLDRCDGLCSM